MTTAPTQAGGVLRGAPATPLGAARPVLVACPGLTCLVCGTPVGCERLHPTAWAWAHLDRPVGCPGLLLAPLDLVYLLHLLPAYRHAKHYLGTGADLPRRLHEHAIGRGANLTRVALAAGGTFELVRLWPGGRKLERQLKQHKAVPRLLCPACPTRTPRANHEPRSDPAGPPPALTPKELP